MTELCDYVSLIDDAEVLQVTRELVAIPSITGHEGDGVLNFLVRWFSDLGIPVRLDRIGDGRANLFADWTANGNPGRFVLNGHQDTKPVMGMTVDPFAGDISGGRLYGRGACDMKGGIAAILCAFKALVRTGVRPRGGITFFSDIEEELGGPNGMNRVLGAGMLDGFEGLISAEPSELEIHIGNRGGYVTAFETHGKTVHSGAVHLGRNAVMDMARFISEYLRLPYLTAENPYFGRATVNFEKIEGGLSDSTVPDRCIACLDSRLIPETPPDRVLAEVRALIDRLTGEHGMDVREIDPPKSWRPSRGIGGAQFIAPGHKLARRVARAVRAATGSEPVIAGCPAATIAGVMIGRGTPAVILGPGSIAQAHTADEWVEVDQLGRAARVYTALMAGM